MVRGNGVDDVFRFIIFPQNVGADGGMCAFNLVIDSFSDVVEQADPACFLLVESEFRGNGAHERRRFNRVFQYVLREAEPEVEAAEKRQERFGNSLNGSVEHGFFSIFKQFVVDFLADLFDEFFDTGRMNASVGDQFFEQTARGFLADRVEAGDHDRFRGVVDENVDACCGFEGADVAPFASDDAAFHFVGRQGDGGGGALIGAVACITLDRGDHEFLRFAFGALFGFIKRIADQDSAFVFHFAFEFFEDQPLGGFAIHAGNAFQFRDLVSEQFFQFLFLSGETLFEDFDVVFLLFNIADFRIERILFAFDVLLFLCETFFRSQLFAAAVADLIFERFFEFDDVGFGGYAGFAEDLVGLFFRVMLHFFRFGDNAGTGCFRIRDTRQIPDDTSACQCSGNPYSNHSISLISFTELSGICRPAPGSAPAAADACFSQRRTAASVTIRSSLTSWCSVGSTRHC